MDVVALQQAQLFAKSLTRGQRRIVATNAHIPTRNSSPNNLSDGVSTSLTTQLQHTVLTGCRGVQLAFSNAYNNNGVSADGPNNINVKTGLKLTDGSFIPVFFRGQRRTVIEPGQTILSDPIGINFARADTFLTRTQVTVYSGEFYPLGLTTDNTAGEGTLAGDLVDSGTITATATKGYGPWGIYGYPNLATLNSPNILVVGDSRVAGFGDTTGGADSRGWVRRAFDGQLSYLNVGVSGTTASGAQTTAQLRQRMALADVAGVKWDAVIVVFGINDLTGGATAAQVEARLGFIYSIFAARGAAVYGATISPVTTSTDSWATLGNQTLVASNANRVTVNNWIRTRPSPLTGYFEFADLVETARDSGFWKTTGSAFGWTADGTHESGTGYAAQAAAITLSTFGGTVLVA